MYVLVIGFLQLVLWPAAVLTALVVLSRRLRAPDGTWIVETNPLRWLLSCRVYLVLAVAAPLWPALSHVERLGWRSLLVILLIGPLMAVALVVLFAILLTRPPVRATLHVSVSEAVPLWVLIVAWGAFGLFFPDELDVGPTYSAYTLMTGQSETVPAPTQPAHVAFWTSVVAYLVAVAVSLAQRKRRPWSRR